VSGIYTVGYESTDVHLFVACLVESDVTVLIDVRDYPGSRKRGFSKNALADALENAGITYEHWRHLGAPKEIRHELKKTKNWLQYAEAYSTILDVQEHTLIELAVKARSERVCLMCFERDHQECHRSLVTGRLISMSLTNKAIHLSPKTTELAVAA
jgi:uncharacterized protein (DUF488 family)